MIMHLPIDNRNRKMVMNSIDAELHSRASFLRNGSANRQNGDCTRGEIMMMELVIFGGVALGLGAILFT